jgi:uncharacterized RDD family membrane protein YckC
VDYQDRIVIATPEGLQLEYTLAGIGSRLTAWLVDTLLRGVVLAAVEVLAVGLVSVTLGAVVLVLGVFGALFVYDVAFEVWGGGQTPAKRWSGLRVVMAGGQPISLGPSAVRTLLRLVDGPGTLFVVGGLAVLLTERNQRLGDLAAGTIVVRESRSTAPAETAPVYRTPDPGIDATAVSAQELAAVRDFLARRDDLEEGARERVAQRLADALAPKVGGLPGDRAPEWVLETIASAKSGRYGSGA